MNLLYDKLTALGFEVERPGGTFYIFPKALEEDANAFCQKSPGVRSAAGAQRQLWRQGLCAPCLLHRHRKGKAQPARL